MTITLTVGTNTYVSLADADAYHTTYANLNWPSTDAGTDEDRKQALILATQAIDLLYGARFMSYLAVQSQALMFPRSQFYDNDGRNQSGIPQCLVKSVCEVALMSMNGIDILPLPNPIQNIKTDMLKVGDLTIQSENFSLKDTESFEGFRKVDMLLRPILRAKSPANWRMVA